MQCPTDPTPQGHLSLKSQLFKGSCYTQKKKKKKAAASPMDPTPTRPFKSQPSIKTQRTIWMMNPIHHLLSWFF
jgi:hypothetical protein